MGKRKIILALAGVVLGICIHSAVYSMGQVKGPAEELVDFTDTPYHEGLNRMSEDCVYDLDFDGQEDTFWFDQNYPPKNNGEIPFVVGCKIGDLRVRLDSLDVKELHAFVLADLDQSDQRCDLIISMTQGPIMPGKPWWSISPAKEWIFHGIPTGHPQTVFVT